MADENLSQEAAIAQLRADLNVVLLASSKLADTIEGVRISLAAVFFSGAKKGAIDPEFCLEIVRLAIRDAQNEGDEAKAEQIALAARMLLAEIKPETTAQPGAAGAFNRLALSIFWICAVLGGTYAALILNNNRDMNGVILAALGATVVLFGSLVLFIVTGRVIPKFR